MIRSRMNGLRRGAHNPTLLNRWEECSALFKIDPTRTSINERVRIAGVKTMLYQYQVFGVWWQLAQSRTSIGGGFLADEMGLGKTLSFLAYIVVERQLSWLWDDIARSEKRMDGRHIPREHANTPGLICPTEDERPHWICCPCSRDNPSSHYGAQRGVRLAVVPQHLVETWMGEWNKHVDVEENSLQMRIIVAHEQTFDKDMSGGYDLRDIRQGANQKYLKAVMPDPRKGPHYAAQSYNGWVKPKFRGIPMEGVERRGIVFGIAVVDECHDDVLGDKGRNAILKDLPSLPRPHIWGLTGTPISHSPRTLEGVLSALAKHAPYRAMDENPDTSKSAWESDEQLRNYTPTKLNNVCTIVEESLRLKRELKGTLQVVDDMLPGFLQTFMIRRTAESTWFNHPLIKLQPHYHTDVFLQHNSTPNINSGFDIRAKYTQDLIATKLAEINKKRADKGDPPLEALSLRAQARLAWHIRILTTLPLLAGNFNQPLGMNFPHLSFLLDETMSLQKDGTRSYYSKRLKQICESSPKLCWLHGFIRRLIKTRDCEGRETNLVIVTNFSPVALVVKLFIELFCLNKQTERKSKVGLILPRTPLRERTNIINAFTDAVDNSGKRKTPKENFQFLVGTTRQIGTGLQLTRANYLVLMEPDVDFSREVQAYCRVHRIGQRNNESWSFRLIDEPAPMGIEDGLVRGERERREEFGRSVEMKSLRGLKGLGVAIGWDEAKEVEDGWRVEMLRVAAEGGC
ncbi:P-loop containing nucleoside triphosphate hydrolase protein [Halenospora varia]|nr:P-loop containing nucleoside triphosphate hydrolase protein [Halenospora varia]